MKNGAAFVDVCATDDAAAAPVTLVIDSAGKAAACVRAHVCVDACVCVCLPV